MHFVMRNSQLVSFNDILAKMMWTELFLDAQGCQVTENVVFCDNQSLMKLETIGKANSGKIELVSGSVGKSA